MERIILGRTGLEVSRTAFGALPIQRTEMSEAKKILRRALEGGINYFDTANAYTDSEEKLGAAFEGIDRSSYVISTKSGARDGATISKHIDLSLQHLKTDYIDLFQFHNVKEMPDEDMLSAVRKAQEAGKVRHIGVTTHSIMLAFELVKSGIYETMQFPFSYISGDREFKLVQLCRENNVGFIAMKGLAGGLLTNARAVHAFMQAQKTVVPIYGIQHMHELEEWLALAEEDPAMDEKLQAVMDRDRKELAGSFCRSCGYCEPCPAGIEIHTCARMNMLLRRSPWKPLLDEETRAKMEKIEDCIHCGRCQERCPYGLYAGELMQYMLKDYRQFYEEHKAEL